MKTEEEKRSGKVEDERAMPILKARLEEENYQKLIKIDNPELHQFVAKYIELCNPDKIFVCSDLPEDVLYIRRETIRAGEEEELAIEGHTVYY